ncbi:MAG TPA: glycosyltransferase, partial [Candidatus Kryptobacter bacterium]|nr:glycosyltransferase [Candidatus Kryptobacter bacterium]
MTLLLDVLFWVAVILVLHSYVVYPLSLVLLSMFRKRYSFVDKNDVMSRKISLLVSAFNEDKTIRERVEGFLSIDYPLFEVIIGVDGATDRTTEILSGIKDSRLKVITFEKNRGKV